MRLGIPWWIGSGPAVDGIELAASLGADFVEVSLDAPWPEGLSAPDLRKAAEDAGIAVGMHGPWRTQALAHPRDVLSRAARTVAQECIDLAVGVGAEYIVFHVDARDFGRFPREDVIEHGLEQAQASLRALSRSAGEEVEILVENTSPPLGTPDGVASFLEPLPEVGFCYDPGHAALALEADAEGASDDPMAWAEAVGDRYDLLHIMDILRGEHPLVDHLVAGAGEADLAREIEAARQAGCQRVLMEAFYTGADRQPASTRDLEEGLDHLRSLL